ncbi:MAG: protein kinase [Planctomycetaceae bacterium]
MTAPIQKSSGVSISQAENRPGERVRYHCVCGETAELDLQTGGRCEACGRRYSAEVARLAATETIQMPFGFEEPIEPDPDTEPAEEGERTPDGRDAPTTIVSPGAEPHAEIPLPSDRRLGHFRIVGRLGRGGMGDVYRALDESLERYVALKVLRPSVNGSAAGADGPVPLLQEARAQARVNHPGVVHIYYVSPDPQRPFLAMELVAGSTLADRLQAGSLTYCETVDVALQIARALRHAARYDVVHGDIKPGNILLAGDGAVKLGDFGLARRLSGRRDEPTGAITGTPHYLPPEVGGAEPDIRSDMYALGVMVFEMTFGRRPYTVESGTLQEHIEAHRVAAPEFPDVWPTELPEGWRGVLERLLEKDPADRYQTHDELIADLERLKPVDLPRAGRVNRGLAWFADLFVALVAGILLLAPFGFLASRGWLTPTPFLSVVIDLASDLLVLFSAAWLQAWWKTSPGKSLLQLRIVDLHGLTPNCPALAMRTVFQLLPLLSVDIYLTMSEIGVGWLGTLVALAGLAHAAVDAGVAAVRPDGRSLHDLLLRTRVVLDTRTESIE